jgi:hypothetical protein
MRNRSVGVGHDELPLETKRATQPIDRCRCVSVSKARNDRRIRRSRCFGHGFSPVVGSRSIAMEYHPRKGIDVDEFVDATVIVALYYERAASPPPTSPPNVIDCQTSGKTLQNNIKLGPSEDDNRRHELPRDRGQAEGFRTKV